MTMAKTDPFSVRLSEDLYERLFVVIQRTGGEITKSEIIERAVNLYLAVLEREPSMIPTYDPEARLSVTQRK
jgi:metal-responsive CopG/Arc/MetJ family transcriptional regulator